MTISSEINAYKNLSLPKRYEILAIATLDAQSNIGFSHSALDAESIINDAIFLNKYKNNMQKLEQIKQELYKVFKVNMTQVIDKLTCVPASNPSVSKDDLTFYARYDASLVFVITKHQLTACLFAITDLASSLLKTEDQESWKFKANDKTSTDVEILLEMKLFEEIILKLDTAGTYKFDKMKYSIGKTDTSKATSFQLIGTVNDG